MRKQRIGNDLVKLDQLISEGVDIAKSLGDIQLLSSIEYDALVKKILHSRAVRRGNAWLTITDNIVRAEAWLEEITSTNITEEEEKQVQRKRVEPPLPLELYIVIHDMLMLFDETSTGFIHSYDTFSLLGVGRPDSLDSHILTGLSDSCIVQLAINVHDSINFADTALSSLSVHINDNINIIDTWDVFTSRFTVEQYDYINFNSDSPIVYPERTPIFIHNAMGVESDKDVYAKKSNIVLRNKFMLDDAISVISITPVKPRFKLYAERIVGLKRNPEVYASFRIERDHNLVAIRVNFTLSGNAYNGSDFETVNEYVDFAQNQTVAYVELIPVTLSESHDYVVYSICTLDSSTEYDIDAEARTARVSIDCNLLFNPEFELNDVQWPNNTTSWARWEFPDTGNDITLKTSGGYSTVGSSQSNYLVLEAPHYPYSEPQVYPKNKIYQSFPTVNGGKYRARVALQRRVITYATSRTERIPGSNPPRYRTVPGSATGDESLFVIFIKNDETSVEQYHSLYSSSGSTGTRLTAPNSTAMQWQIRSPIIFSSAYPLQYPNRDYFIATGERMGFGCSIYDGFSSNSDGGIDWIWVIRIPD